MNKEKANKMMAKIMKGMRKETCKNQLKAIDDRVSMAMEAGETQLVISPICDENLKAVIVTYEAIVTRAKEEHGLALDVLSWEKDLPRNAFSDKKYLSNFSEKEVSFDEFKKLVGMKKKCEMKMRDVEKNKV